MQIRSASHQIPRPARRRHRILLFAHPVRKNREECGSPRTLCNRSADVRIRPWKSRRCSASDSCPPRRSNSQAHSEIAHWPTSATVAASPRRWRTRSPLSLSAGACFCLYRSTRPRSHVLARRSRCDARKSPGEFHSVPCLPRRESRPPANCSSRPLRSQNSSRNHNSCTRFGPREVATISPSARETDSSLIAAPRVRISRLTISPEAAEIRGEVHAGAAHASSINYRALLFCFILRGLAKSSGLQLGMIGQQVFAQNFYFVVRVVRFGEIRPLLQHHYAESVGR